MPQAFDYLLFGGGTSCGYAAAAIRELDKDSTVGILSADNQPPYDRPPFSKNFLTNDNMDVSDAHSKDESFYSENNVDLLLDCEAFRVKIGPRAVELRNGELVHYRKMLYALGSEPKKPNIPGLENAIFLRTASDSERIKELAKVSRSAVIIGGGYIGSEVAASLLKRGLDVTIIEFDKKIWPKFTSQNAADAVQRELQKMGAKMHFGEEVVEISNGARTKSGMRIEADFVVAGIGAAPRLKLGKDAGLVAGSQGLQGDPSLRSSDANIWLAGDVVEYPDPIMGRNFRAEHHMHAQWTGAHAGRAMAGEAVPYKKVPYFFSDIGELSMIFRGDTEPQGKSFVLGDLQTPEFTEIFINGDGIITTMTDLRRDFKAQEPINELFEDLISRKASAMKVTDQLSQPGFDVMKLREL